METPKSIRPGRDVFVLGASAGGIEPLSDILRVFPADLAAAVFIVVHRPSVPTVRNLLSTLLQSAGGLRVVEPHDGERPLPGHAYVAPAGCHLLLERGHIRLEYSPREQQARPALDTLFRSAANAYGRRVVGVVMSGMLRDGTVGLWQVKQHGGLAIVQDPTDANYPKMPQSALAEVHVDYCLPAVDIGRLLVEVAAKQAEPPPPPLSGPATARIAIVEDERIIARNLEKQLTGFGYEVTSSVVAGEECLTAMESALPQLVLMDIHLPGKLSGTDTARRLWQEFHVPVIYITAYTDADTLDEVKGTECYGYIVKPFEVRAVHAAVQVALERLDRGGD